METKFNEMRASALNAALAMAKERNVDMTPEEVVEAAKLFEEYAIDVAEPTVTQDNVLTLFKPETEN
jgi:hypothetical protein